MTVRCERSSDGPVINDSDLTPTVHDVTFLLVLLVVFTCYIGYIYVKRRCLRGRVPTLKEKES